MISSEIKEIKGISLTGEAGSRTAYKIIKEEPLKIVIGSTPYAVLMRTPGDEKDLVSGFLYSEGVIKDPGDVDFIHCCVNGKEKNTAIVGLKNGKSIKKKNRAFEVRSSCGLCGEEVIDKLKRDLNKVSSEKTFKYKDIVGLDKKIIKTQTFFQRTGGTHAAAVFNRRGEILFAREDIGRHNALDKVIGHILEENIDVRDKLIFLTGRTSYEMVLKSIRIGFPVVSSISGTTTLAVELSRNFNITLVGFMRGSSMSVYTHPWRIEGK